MAVIQDDAPRARATADYPAVEYRRGDKPVWPLGVRPPANEDVVLPPAGTDSGATDGNGAR